MFDVKILLDEVDTGLNQLTYSHSSISYLEALGSYLSKHPDSGDGGLSRQLYLDEVEVYGEMMKILEEQKKRIDGYTELLKNDKEAV